MFRIKMLKYGVYLWSSFVLFMMAHKNVLTFIWRNQTLKSKKPSKQCFLYLKKYYKKVFALSQISCFCFFVMFKCFIPTCPCTVTSGCLQSMGERWQVTSPPQGNIETHYKQPCRHSFTPKDGLERQINLTVLILGCRRKPEYPERMRASTGRTCKLLIDWDLNQGSSCCKATVLPTAPLCSLK